MRKCIKSLFIIFLLFMVFLPFYLFVIEPVITTWGASKEDQVMSMAGDDSQSMIISTRSISIDAPKDQVWSWLMTLGADRWGFYSYYFIEKALGYKTRYSNLSTPVFKDFALGDMIRGSIKEQKSIIPYEFTILYIEPGNVFVLSDWGAFMLTSINDHQTRSFYYGKRHDDWYKITG